MWTLSDFYRSKEWEAFRQVVIAERTQDDGFIYDEVTGKPIVRRYDIILHHTTFLTEENVNDRTISLNPENIQIVSHRTHNKIHEKFGYKRKEIFLIYGPPLAGKTTYVRDVMVPGDLIIDMDNIWQCISGLSRYQKPGKLRSVAFGVRDYLMDAAKVRNGKWQNCYIIGGFPLISDRERILKTYGARQVFIEATREECMARLSTDQERDADEWTGYIDEWFRRYYPPRCG
jgi:hypothetical protein